MTKRAIVVTACDAGFFHLAGEMIASLHAAGLPEGVTIGCMDLGLSAEQVASFREQGVAVLEPRTLLDHPFTGDDARRKMGYLARAFLRETAPGYGTYIWMDADTWVQGPEAIRHLLETAEATGSATVLEKEPSYRHRLDLFGWKLVNFIRGYGYVRGIRLALQPHVNNGVFALRADASHWEPWRRYHQEGLDRSGRAAPFDQFGLNAAIRFERLPTTFLPATFNWICDLGEPMVKGDPAVLCSRAPGHATIQVVHLAGPVKEKAFELKTVEGGRLTSRLRYPAFARQS